MPTRLRLDEKSPQTLTPSWPLGTPPSLYLSYTTFTLSYWQESLESAAEGVGWSWGVMGVQTSAGGATGPSIPAVLVVGTAQIRMRLRICRSDAILARSVRPWQCIMRASSAQNRALHSGMRVVCVWVRKKSPFHPLTLLSTVDMILHNPLKLRHDSS